MNLPSTKRPRASASPSVILIAAALLLGVARPASALDDGLARTPPMGWNSWNKFGCNVSDTLVRGMADAMVSSGMKDAGYEYVIIDDCWAASRDTAGNILPDASRFPNGMKALADYVHAKGLKFGLYTDAGTTTCSGRPGTLGHEQQDADTYASWGVDYVKEDWCSTGGLTPATQFAKFRDALAAAGRPVVLGICDWGIDNPWTWGPTTGHLWRTTGDITDSWTGMLSNLDSNAAHASAARPGAWNDPDMLEIGNGGMSTTEYRSHMSLWAIMAAPLIAGNDLRSMSQDTHDLLTNPEVLAVDQDPAGVQGTKVSDDGAGLQVWAKKLQSGAVAVALLNRSSATATLTATWSAVGLPAGSATVRDLWARADRGSFTSSYSASVPSHGTVLLKIVGGSSSGGGGTLTVTRSGAGTGTVTSSPSGIDCGSACSASYASGTAVTLTPTAASGSTFGGWSGACVGTGTCIVTMTADQAVTASFTATTPTYPITVTRAGTGGGTVTSSAGGISCGSTCSASLAGGTVVTLTAAAASGSTFGGWSGACSGTGACVVTMTAAQAVTASFAATTPTYAITVTRAGTGSGAVTSSAGGIDCGSTCSATLAGGTTVTLTATAASGSTFNGWSGACSGSSATCAVSMSAAKAVTATFDKSSSGGTCTAASGGQSGNFNTTGAICFTVSGTIHGWGCYNDAGRTVTVNGTDVTCGALPLPGSSPYTFSFTAGTYPWAGFYWW